MWAQTRGIVILLFLLALSGHGFSRAVSVLFSSGL